MIRIELDVMLARRKMTLTELSRRLDIALPNLSILKNGHAKAIRMALLDALCRELDCQPDLRPRGLQAMQSQGNLGLCRPWAK